MTHVSVEYQHVAAPRDALTSDTIFTRSRVTESKISLSSRVNVKLSDNRVEACLSRAAEYYK